MKRSPNKTSPSTSASTSSSTNASPPLSNAAPGISNSKSDTSNSCSPPKKAKLANDTNTSGSDASNLSLRNIFTGMKLHVVGDENSPEYVKLTRYFIAHDGDLVEPYEADKRTLVITLTDDDDMNEKFGKHVQQDWIYDSIKAGKLVSIEKYLI